MTDKKTSKNSKYNMSTSCTKSIYKTLGDTQPKIETSEKGTNAHKNLDSNADISTDKSMQSNWSKVDKKGSKNMNYAVKSNVRLKSRSKTSFVVEDLQNESAHEKTSNKLKSE